MIPRLFCWSRNSTRRSLSSSSSSTVATTTTSSINSSSSVSLVHFWWRRLAAIAMLSSTTSYPYSSILLGGYSWGLTATSSSARSVHRPHVSLFAAAASTTTPDSDNHNTMNQDSSQDPTTCSNSGDENDMPTEHTPSPRIFQHADDTITVHHFGPDSPIASTQDEARRILQQQSGNSSTSNNNLRYLAVLADRQTNGRGTSGRSWEYGAGNLYLTLCIPFHEIPVMPTLLPLQIAVTIAQQVQKTLSPSSLAAAQEDVVHVKWPNDVLLRDQKLAGTLIESELVMNTNTNANDDGTTAAAAGSTTWLLIGIGVNIEHTPSLQGTPGKHVRSPVCLRDYWNLDKEGSQPVAAVDLGLRISESLVKWVSQSSAASASASHSRATREAQVVQEWKALFPFGSVYEMRASDPQQEMKDDFVGEKVVAVDLRYDGQLVVQGADGKERLLIADYLF